MLKRIFFQSKWFRFYTYFTCFSTLGGISLSQGLIGENLVLGLFGALLWVGIVAYLLIWFIWFVVIILKVAKQPISQSTFINANQNKSSLKIEFIVVSLIAADFIYSLIF